jgi:SAM-dependent methyltransferase
MSRRVLYVAAEKDPLHLHALRNRFLRTPNVAVQRFDPAEPTDIQGLENCFDTVLCLNVLEYLDDPAGAVARLHETLKPNGVLIVLVPNVHGLFGSLDQSLGHKRRFSPRELRQLMESQGFAVESLYHFNKAGTPPWWAYGKMLGSTKINKPILKVFDKTVWLWRRLDPILPWPGLSLVVVARSKRPGYSGMDRAAVSEVSHRNAI